MSLLTESLRAREQTNDHINVALVGAGSIGTSLVCQMERMEGIRASAVCDLRIERATSALAAASGSGGDVVATLDLKVAESALNEGKRVATTNALLLAQLTPIDVVMELTGSIELGARLALEAILNHKHVVFLHSEVDITVGYLLRRMAEAAGVVYTVSAGHEHAATKELVDFARAMSLRVVAAGKGKNSPLDFDATPDSVADSAARVPTTPRIQTGYVDGTNTMVEMTALANATGLVPDVSGMHGPTCTVQELARVFSLKSQGGLLNREGVVDYALGPVAPGVFAVVTTDCGPMIGDMRFHGMGPGPNWVLSRPYHLTHLEAPLSAARAVLFGEAALATTAKPVAETVVVAKRDLRAGEKLDYIGGFSFRGIIETADAAAASRHLPVGLAEDTELTHDVAKGQPVTYDQVKLSRKSTVVQLRVLQDQMLCTNMGCDSMST
jgi:predicted homoserine dehydrogenase-like protein